MEKTEELQKKILRVIDRLTALSRDNERLRAECASLQSHLTLLGGENHKAQKILAEYEDLRHKREQAAHRVEHALSTLGAMR